jgi:cytoskeleton protein RodZ
MSTVAEQLRLAREAKSFTVHQVAEVTKIRGDHIRALEEGNFNAFSAPVYIRGFVRTYAGLLKLDVPRLMTALDEELGRTEKFREPPPLTEHSRGVLDFITLQLSKLNWRVTTAIVGGIIVLLIVILSVNSWRHRQTTDPLAHTPPAAYESTQTGDTLPVPAATPRR